MRERLRWLGNPQWAKDDRLSKTGLVGQMKSSSSPNGDGEFRKGRFQGNRNLLEDIKRSILNKLGLKRSVRSCVGLRRLAVAVSCL